MAATLQFEDFEASTLRTPDTTVFFRRGGSGPPLFLLHGFPQTHQMWRHVAPILARGFTVICPDLRGFGQSRCPRSTSDHQPYSKRAMARDILAIADQHGFDRLSIAGHDRGGRVAYRFALDHPARVCRLAVLDVLTIADAWENADKRLAVGYWPWSLLAQAEPLPERLVSSAPDAIVDNALEHWGTSPDVFTTHVRAAYIDALRDPDHVHAICEEFRAAATIDHDHDSTDRREGRRISCPMIVLWGRGGPLDTWYQEEGGPIAFWQQWAHDVRGQRVDGGHFFPEAAPEETAGILAGFFQERIPQLQPEKAPNEPSSRAMRTSTLRSPKRQNAR